MKLRLVSLLALALAVAGPALAAAGHSHGGGSASALELTLNDGKPWPTDEALRRGMTGIRAAVAAALPQIHSGRFSSADFVALADSVEKHVEGIAADCKLPEQADLQLHVVLARILEGAQAAKASADKVDGAVAIVEALDAYAAHFDHPGWTPLQH